MSNYQVVHFLFTLIMVLVLSYLFHQVFAKYKGLATEVNLNIWPFCFFYVHRACWGSDDVTQWIHPTHSCASWLHLPGECKISI